MDRRNCWDYKSCGREPGGSAADACGVCPAAAEHRVDGVHGGVNAGRACWVVAGTLSDGRPQCLFAQERECIHCDFYLHVLDTEAPHIVFTPAIKSLLESDGSTAGWLVPGTHRD